jgi:hypothetical protein
MSVGPYHHVRYARVNKKALEQYVSFSEQRDALIGRKDEQDSADKSIQDLIKVLDGQKDEAIERTFKQVSKLVASCTVRDVTLVRYRVSLGSLAGYQP